VRRARNWYQLMVHRNRIEAFEMRGQRQLPVLSISHGQNIGDSAATVLEGLRWYTTPSKPRRLWIDDTEQWPGHKNMMLLKQVTTPLFVDLSAVSVKYYKN